MVVKHQWTRREYITYDGQVYLHLGHLRVLLPHWYRFIRQQQLNKYKHVSYPLTLLEDERTKHVMKKVYMPNMRYLYQQFISTTQQQQQIEWSQNGATTLNELCKIAPPCIQRMIQQLKHPQTNRSHPLYLKNEQRRILYPTLYQLGVHHSEIEFFMKKRAEKVYSGVKNIVSGKREVEGNTKYWLNKKKENKIF
jgi:hypothetical protein